MDKVQKFEDLLIFQRAKELCIEVYKLTKQGEFKYDSRFQQQIRAAAGSIMDNIAEGFEREGNKEFINFLYIAKGSCGEVRSQIIRAHSVGFINDETYQNLYTFCIGLSKGIASFIHSQKTSGYKGAKYLEPESSKFKAQSETPLTF